MNELTTKLVQSILNLGVDGGGPLCSAADLAAEYERNERYQSTEDRVRALIRWESAKAFAGGMVTSLGGAVTLPIALPAGLLSTWLIQARLAAAVAILHGHSIDDDQVRTQVLLTLLGGAGADACREVGVALTAKAASAACARVPGDVLRQLNRAVGFRLLTKAGTRGVLNLSKVVPVIAGVVGGGIDAAACRVAGLAAVAAFR